MLLSEGHIFSVLLRLDVDDGHLLSSSKAWRILCDL